MTPTTLSIESLLLVTGGQQTTPAPAPSPTPRRERTDAELEARMNEKEAQRAWEKTHPFSAMLCQGDPDCLRDGGMP